MIISREMQLLWSSQLCFALFLAAVWRISEATEIKDTEVSSYRNKTTLNGFSKQEFKCGWSCEVMESALNNSINTAFNEGKILISLWFRYEKKVDKRCVNETSHSLRQFVDKGWQIWLVNNNLPKFACNAIRKLSSLLRANSPERMVEANCTLNLKTTSTDSQARYSQLSPNDHLENIIRSTVGSLRKLCTTELDQNDLQTCIKISEYNRDSFQWAEKIGVLFMLIFTYFGPAVVCFYSATEVTREGVRQITVEGPSPVGFRSLIGNYFFSTDNTMWHTARKFIMRVVLLPIPFLVPAIFVEYLLYQNELSLQTSLNERMHLFRPFIILCYGCYCIQAFYFHFIMGKPNPSRSHFLSFHCICPHRELPQRMLIHLGNVWWFFTKLWFVIWDLIIKPLYQKIKSRLVTYLSGINSFSSFCPLLGFIVCFILLLCLIFLCFFLFVELLLITTLPIAVLCTSANISYFDILDINFQSVVLLPNICMSCLAAIGGMVVLKFAAVGVMIFLQLAVNVLLSEENLPFVACCVLVSYYSWSSYRSFTQKYLDLAVKLFEQYDQLTDSARNTDLNKQRITPDHGRTIDNAKRIPKELFDMACEELMPIRESICVMVLKATSSAIFVFFIFLLTMLLNASPVITTLVTFVAGSFPKIFTIYVHERRQRNAKAMTIDEKDGKIALDYIKSTSINHQSEKGISVSPADSVKQLVDEFPQSSMMIGPISFMFSFIC